MMKTNKYLTFFLLIFVIACNNEENIDPFEEEKLSLFRVEYEQSGDLENFVKTVAIGQGFLYTDTKEEAPELFLNDDLDQASYSFISKEPVKEIELNITAGWLPIGNEYAEMKMVLKIYKDGSLIDEKEYVTTSDDVATVIQIAYKSGD